MNYCQQCGSKVIQRQLDGATRYQCENTECQKIYWNNPVPVVAALVRLGDKYVIARNSLWPEGIFSLITGYLEAEEAPEIAVVREVAEELGLSEARVVNYLGHHLFKEKNQLILAFEVEAQGDIKLNHELSEYKLLGENELSIYNFKPLYITEAIINNWKGITENIN